ncbi:MAG: N-acetylmuramoyl-L-alanine amidase, partial [Candidatus Binatia bacterium]
MMKKIIRCMLVAVAWLTLHGAVPIQRMSDAAAQGQRSEFSKEPGNKPTTPAAARAANGDIPANIETPRSAEEEKKTESTAPSVASDKSLLSGVRLLSSPAYTRVMMDLSKEVKYDVRRIKEDPANGLPPRIYVDIHGAKLAMNSKEAIAVGDGLLRQVRVGQFTQDVVRVVLDMDSLNDHNAFMLADPFRLIIDIHGQKPAIAAAPVPKKTITTAAKDKKPAAPPPSGIRKIVLDPGHGGKDPGAIGAGGIAEKDLVLIIAKKLAAKLKREMGMEVILTRKDDRFIPLEGRTAIANAEDADLFVSLHMNASPNAEARGLETYYLDNTTDEASMRLAARENSTSRKNVSDLQFILSDMMQNMKLDDSISLAHRLQSSLVGGMSRKIADVKDLGVKKALFYVLVGA